MGLLFVGRSAPPRPMVAPMEPPRVDPPALPERPQAVPSRFHHVTHEFKVDEFWPAAELPPGLEGTTSLEGAELLKTADLPPAILHDLAYSRGLEFQKGKALMVGLQFKTEFARRRWSKEPGWKREMDLWHYHLFGESQGVILIRHDGSAAGMAAKDVLENFVEKKLADLYPPPPKKK